MITLNDDDRALLSQVLESRPDRGRKGNPRLRPLSMYSSELKNLKQVASAVDRASKGQELADVAATARRYGNTLSNMGLWEGTDRGIDMGAAGLQLLELAKEDDGSPEFWQLHSRRGDRIFFEHQVGRLLSDRQALVNDLWREVFLNVQDVLDHLSETDVRVALAETDLKEIEFLQYIDSVGTEPWRYSRLSTTDRAATQDLILRLRADFETTQVAQGDPLLASAIDYAWAMRTFQRDVRFRVAGFLEAFLDVRAKLGARFPRVAPDLQVRIPPAVAGQGGVPPAGAGTEAAERPTLPLPVQVIISGCPGSGKSALAERSVEGALVIRTQFHAETSTAAFVGGYRPAPVYEANDGIREAAGTAFEKGRPLIDYRFVPGQALLAVEAAIAEPNRNVVLLIEELNRGNAAAIFGELFQLLDRRDDGWSRYGVSPGSEAGDWLRTCDALDADGALRFPPNLHIWATMNSGDQGVFPIDTAFRRRWSYRYLGYAEPCLYPVADRVVRFGGRDLDWDLLRAALNRRLKSLQVNEDRLVGPYFLTPTQLRDPAEVLSKLLLYLWDDVLRFRQHELFVADSFAGVTAAWKAGEGNPILEAVLDLDAALSNATSADGVIEEGQDGEIVDLDEGYGDTADLAAPADVGPISAPLQGTDGAAL